MTFMVTFKLDADPVGKQEQDTLGGETLSRLTPLTKLEPTNL